MEENIYVSPDDIRGKTGEVKFIQNFLKNKEGMYDVSESGFPFVTISRESSAGGHLLSHVLMSDVLKQDDPSGLFRGWHIFDRKLCEMIAQDAAMHNSVTQLLHEKYHSEFKDYIDSLFTGQSDKYTIHKTTSRVIHMLAAIGRVIIVSSNACCITRNMKAGIHVRLVAPEQKRVTWMMKRFNMNKNDAEKAVKEQDASQRKLIDKFFNKNVEDPLLYDMVWNTSRIEMQEISHSIINLIRNRARKPLKDIIAPEI